TVAPLITGTSPWVLLQNIAAIALGPFAFAHGNAGAILLFAVLIHLFLSLAYVILIEPIMRKLDPGTAILLGAGYGCALYFMNYHLLSFLVPWFIFSRGGAALSAHMIYGATVGTLYPQLHRARVAETEAEEERP